MARSAPDWPRLMRRATAAAYCDLSPADFERVVTASQLPLPVKIGREDHWSRVQLDEYCAAMFGEGVDDWRKQQPAYAA